MDKVFYYSIMTKLSIIKSLSDLDNKVVIPVSGSSSQMVWNSSDSDTEDGEENIDGMHRDLRMRKALLATVSSAEFNTMTMNSKLSYIQDKKAWERIYVLLKILFPCLRTLRLADINKAGMNKIFYYSIMTKMSIIKSSTDLDNK